MNSTLKQMLAKYTLKDKNDYVNALKEIVQEITLASLANTDFFDHAAFYGGTALRIFYGLDRFSEDLDFSLMVKENFSIEKYFPYLKDSFEKLGMSFIASKIEKNNDSDIQSAFLKGNTLEHMLLIGVNDNIIEHIQKSDVIKVKFEIDVNPPKGATYEFKFRTLPSPYKIRLYDKDSLFAGKLHAVICRNWKNRFKGRDLYDYLYYISTKIKPNIKHLKERLIESHKWDLNKELTLDDIKTLLLNRFNEIDFEQAKDDVKNFIDDVSKLD